MNQHQFYYQPSPIFSTIDWCWTLVVLLTGIIFWLEVTHVQWITVSFFIVFFIIAGLEIFNRQLIIKGPVLIIKDMFGRQWRRYNIKEIADNITFTKHTIIIKNHDRVRQFSLWANDIKELRAIIQTVAK